MRKNDKYLRAREQRLPYVEYLLIRGYSLRKIQTATIEKFKLESYNLRTVMSDKKIIQERWVEEEKLGDPTAARMEQIREAKERKLELWAKWQSTGSAAYMVEIRRNDEHIADLLQLGKEKDGGKQTIEINVKVDDPETAKLIDEMPANEYIKSV